MYFVCWDPQLIPDKQTDPMELKPPSIGSYSPNMPIFLPPGWFLILLSWFTDLPTQLSNVFAVAGTSCPIVEEKYAQMKKFILEYKDKGHCVGQIDKYHMVIADKEGMDSPRALQLAELFAQNIGMKIYLASFSFLIGTL